jgi:hypothetical protein
MSIVMVAVGLWIRLGILETPVFQRILAENKVERAPTIEVRRARMVGAAGASAGSAHVEGEPAQM